MDEFLRLVYSSKMISRHSPRGAQAPETADHSPLTQVLFAIPMNPGAQLAVHTPPLGVPVHLFEGQLPLPGGAGRVESMQAAKGREGGTQAKALMMRQGTPHQGTHAKQLCLHIRRHVAAQCVGQNTHDTLQAHCKHLKAHNRSAQKVQTHSCSEGFGFMLRGRFPLKALTMVQACWTRHSLQPA